MFTCNITGTCSKSNALNVVYIDEVKREPQMLPLKRSNYICIQPGTNNVNTRHEVSKLLGSLRLVATKEV